MSKTYEEILSELMCTVDGCQELLRLWCADRPCDLPEPEGEAAIRVVQNALSVAYSRALDDIEAARDATRVHTA